MHIMAKYNIDILTVAEVRQLIAQCSTRSPTGVRDAALISVLYRGGVRIAEALALHERDLNAERGTLTVQRGKGSKYRVIGLDAEAFAFIERWITKKRKVGLDKKTPLFCTLKGGYIQSQQNMRDMLKRRAKKAGIDKRVHPHGLRHTVATELAIDEKVDLPTVQGFLGHASIAATETYIKKIAPAAVVETGKNRSSW